MFTLLIGLVLTSFAWPLALAYYAPEVAIGGFCFFFAYTLLLPTLVSCFVKSSAFSPDFSLNFASYSMILSSLLVLFSYCWSNLPSWPSSLSLATFLFRSGYCLWKLNFPVSLRDLRGDSSKIGYSSFYCIYSIYNPSCVIRSAASSGIKSGQAFFVEAGITVPSAHSTKPTKLFYRLSSFSSFKFIATSISLAWVSASSTSAASCSSSNL